MTEIKMTLPNGEKVGIKGEFSLEDLGVVSDESWITTPIFGAESVTIDGKTIDHDVHYSLEKFFGNNKENGAPPAGKMKISAFGYGTGVAFSDGSKAENDVNAIFTSPYVKGKINEFNDYYIKQKGFQPFTQQDANTLRTDVAQILRKVFQYNFVNKVQIKFFKGTAVYGLFDHLLGTAVDKLLGSKGGAEGGLKGLFINTFTNRGVPFCIVYTKEDNGKKRVFVRRFLVVGIWSKRITEGHAKAASGGKEIGTVR
jgi:hypothetical protein